MCAHVSKETYYRRKRDLLCVSPGSVSRFVSVKGNPISVKRDQRALPVRVSRAFVFVVASLIGVSDRDPTELPPPPPPSVHSPSVSSSHPMPSGVLLKLPPLLIRRAPEWDFVFSLPSRGCVDGVTLPKLKPLSLMHTRARARARSLSLSRTHTQHTHTRTYTHTHTRTHAHTQYTHMCICVYT